MAQQPGGSTSLVRFFGWITYVHPPSTNQRGKGARSFSARPLCGMAVCFGFSSNHGPVPLLCPLPCVSGCANASRQCGPGWPTTSCCPTPHRGTNNALLHRGLVSVVAGQRPLSNQRVPQACAIIVPSLSPGRSPYCLPRPLGISLVPLPPRRASLTVRPLWCCHVYRYIPLYHRRRFHPLFLAGLAVLLAALLRYRLRRAARRLLGA
jgi:hypothetical protein